MEKDRIFAAKQETVPAFEFNEAVASVFSDMLERSVPNYVESITRQAQLAVDFYRENTRIYDLGCSHGNLGIIMGKTFGGRDFSMVGVDSSQPMIDKYEQRLQSESFRDKVSLVCDRAENVAMSNASVVVVNLTLQFLDLNLRDALVADIYKALAPGGILLLTEKVVSVHDVVSELQLDYYKRFKRENGYSELEISQKREALEDVLVPETLEDHQDRLKRAGFTTMDVWLKWFNFASMIAVK
ncbi:MAG: carboxy-S-adenosyl-L-methionine synthase CmoA [Desulfobacteraceae bacterium]|nr:carboxy-S-adenosyl-L-methionine synthase CmoA [Desulfobacteraceae bacterium]